MNKSLATSRVYEFEGEVFKNSYLNKLDSIFYLRDQGRIIWEKYYYKQKYFSPLFKTFMVKQPEIIAGRGIPHGRNKVLYSYYDENTHKIVLSRHQRNRITLVHELVHAMGYPEHNAEFVKKLLHIYIWHYNVDSYTINKQAEEYKLPGFV